MLNSTILTYTLFLAKTMALPIHSLASIAF